MGLVLPETSSLPSVFSCFWSLGFGVHMGSRQCYGLASQLEARFEALALILEWRWPGVISTMAHTPLCSLQSEEPKNPKPWTNLVTAGSQRSHGPL